jgi:hypothetical protein
MTQSLPVHQNTPKVRTGSQGRARLSVGFRDALISFGLGHGSRRPPTPPSAAAAPTRAGREDLASLRLPTDHTSYGRWRGGTVEEKAGMGYV